MPAVVPGPPEAIAESSMTEGGHQEAPAAPPNIPMVAGATDCIHEIFHYARKLCRESNAVDRRFVLDEAAFMAELDEPPLFLRRA
jgi:hypothetical protein